MNTEKAKQKLIDACKSIVKHRDNTDLVNLYITEIMNSVKVLKVSNKWEGERALTVGNYNGQQLAELMPFVPDKERSYAEIQMILDNEFKYDRMIAVGERK